MKSFLRSLAEEATRAKSLRFSPVQGFKHNNDNNSLVTCKCGFDIRVVLCTSVPSLILTQPSYRHKQLLLPEAICCCFQSCNCGFAVPVYQVSLSENQVIGRNVSLQVLLPEAVCCCLQTCTCGFDIRVVLCTSVPSLIGIQVLMPEAVCDVPVYFVGEPSASKL